MNQLDRIETMLKAILASDNHVHWVGSYAHGRASSGDPYIVLFPSSDKLEHQVCRVYESQFKKLPAFVDTAVPASIKPSKKAPGKNQATPCRHFQVITCNGRETQMGAEKRFFGVLAISSQAATVHVDSKQEAEKRPSTPRQPKPKKQPAIPSKDWKAEAASCTDAFMFDTAVVQLEPWYQDAAAVTQFREVLFGDWEPEAAAALVDGLVAYAATRKGGKSHNAAKKTAVTKYENQLAAAKV